MGMEEKEAVQGRGRAQGRRMVLARRVTLTAVFVAVLASLAFDCGLGTPSSFGIGQFNLLCPLGGLEAMFAAKSFIPIAAISAGVVLAFSLLFGRAWCAWGCPAPVIRRFFKRDPKPASLGDQGCEGGCSACAGVASALDVKESLRGIAKDSRTWVLVAVLVCALVAGLPLFCLVCPIGLTFGSVASLWHLIVDKQMTASVLVFPIALAVELVLCRKWCMNVCPVAGLLGIFGRFAVRFRPHVNVDTCLRASKGVACDVCTVACAEHIDLHAADVSTQLGMCTRCGECAKRCPTASIEFK